MFSISIDEPRARLPSVAFKWHLSHVMKKPIAQIGLIVLVAAVLCLPFLLVGIFIGSYDAWTHTDYQHHFSSQFWTGEWYPRWLAGANKGYGSPIFFIQYPLPYFTTALLRPLLSFLATPTREGHELGVYCFLVMCASGIAARAWFRNRYTPAASTAAALLYIMLPFMLGQALYTRAAIGELTTFIWMPLLLALSDCLYPVKFHVWSGLAAVFALLVMSNMLSAVLFTPLLLIYIAGFRKASLASALSALAFGACLAAVYLLPLFSYRRLFDDSAMPAHHPFFELGRSLLQIGWPDLGGQQLIALPGIVMTASLTIVAMALIWRGQSRVAERRLMLLTLALGFVTIIPGAGKSLISLSGLNVSGFDEVDAYSMKMLFTVISTASLGMIAYCRLKQPGARDRSLIVVSCVAVFFMLPVSAWFWKAVPQLAFIQFPWRLCGVLNVATAGLFAGALDHCFRFGYLPRRPSLRVILSVAIVVVASGCLVWRIDRAFRAFSTPSVDVTNEVDVMYPTYVPPKEVNAFAGLMGTSPNTFEVARTPVQEGVHADFIDGSGTLALQQLGPRRLHLSVTSTEEARVQLSQMWFPLWTMNTGRIASSSTSNLLQVKSPPGRHEYEFTLGDGLPERIGLRVTVLSIFIAACGTLFSLRRSLRTAINPETAVLHSRRALDAVQSPL